MYTKPKNRFLNCDRTGYNNNNDCAWQSFKNGDVEALESIYLQYFDTLCLYGQQFADGDSSLVEDCLQDLFMKLYTNPNKGNLSDTSSIRFYLMKALRRLILYKRKYSYKYNKVLQKKIDDSVDMEMSMCDSNDDRIDERKMLLKNYMQHLPGRQREAIYLRFFEEMEFDEIATKMNLIVKSVYKVIYKGLGKLKNMYDNRSATYI
jgi:RNA polymerase sigma factor (sigma-70 family)